MIISLIKYSAFAFLSISVVALFVFTKNYYQLILASLLYIPTIYLGLKIFPRFNKEEKQQETENQTEYSNKKTSDETILEPDYDKIEISDINKRAFLKLIGVAGISYFVFSILGQKSNLFSPEIKKDSNQKNTLIEDTTGKTIDPAEKQPLDGFRINEIDDGVITYYGYTNKDGAWVIIKEDTENNSFRYIKGENDFSQNWNRRTSLNYDYYHNVF